MKDVAKTGWETKPLGEVCQLINGRAYKKLELLDEGPYPVLRVGNFFTNNHWYYSDLELDEDKYCDDGDLLYAWSASFGPRIWEGGKVIYHYHIWKVLPSEHVDRDFLYYFFDWDKELIKKEQGAGATMIHVSKRSMEARAIPLPPLEEQQRIVAVLDEAFEGLARARAHAEANLQNARELFDSALIDALHSRRSDWRTLSVANTLTRTKVPAKIQRKAYLAEGIFPIVSQEAGLVNGCWNNEDDVIHLTRPVVVFGDHTRVLKYVDFDFVVGADGTQIMAPVECLEPRYYYYALKTIDLEGKGYARHFSHLKKCEISFPTSIEAQRTIASQLDDLSANTQRLEEQYARTLQDLDDLRQSLLQKAFAGELT